MYILHAVCFVIQVCLFSEPKRLIGTYEVTMTKQNTNPLFIEELRQRHEQRIVKQQSDEIEEFEKTRENCLEIVNELAEGLVDITRYRNERSIMALPLFSTRCTKRSPRETQPIYHEIRTAKGTKKFTVTPDPRLGMPDEVDANILRFAISKGREVRHKVGYFPSHIDTTRFELCQVLGLKPSGQTYKTLIQRLERLEAARFKGNIFSFNEKDIYGGSLITYRYVNETLASSPIRIEFTVSFRKHLEQEDVCLTVPDEIMKMQSSLQIRLVELIRLRMGGRSRWIIGLERLKQECNIPERYNLKYFKRDIQRLVLPYAIAFSKDRRLTDQNVLFSR